MSFIFPEWRQRLARSLHVSRSKPESKYIQIATYAPVLGVQNRTVVFRGFVEDSHVLQCITEKDSDKYRALQYAQESEICWYFPKTREQYRLSVHTQLVGSTNDEAGLRQQMWQNLSVAAKQSFIDNQKLDLEQSCGPRHTEVGTDSPTEEVCLHEQVPENFILILCSVYAVDYLILSEPHQRFKSFCEMNEWVEESAKP